MKIDGHFTSKTEEARVRQARLHEIQMSLMPKFGHAWHWHSLVGMKVEALSRLVYYNELYQMILDVPGVICEFGVHWGATFTQLMNLRSMYEPFNYSRTICGFDTFEGFPSVTEKDGTLFKAGDYKSTDGYLEVLREILQIHEANAPMAHIPKHELIKGDASETFSKWMDDNPHAIISMAIFDMDIYQPTKDVLEQIIPRLTKGSLLVFDELNCKHFPGETIAVREVLETHRIKLKRSPRQTFGAWAIWGE